MEEKSGVCARGILEFLYDGKKRNFRVHALKGKGGDYLTLKMEAHLPFPGHATLVDLIYNPTRTRLMTVAEAAGAFALTSVRIRSPVSGAVVFISSLAMRIASPSERARLVLLAQVVPHRDRGDVHQDHDQEQEHRGRVHHRLGGFHVR